MTAAKTKRELIEIGGLQVLVADPVMGSNDRDLYYAMLARADSGITAEEET